MTALRKSQLLIVLVITAVVCAAPPHHCDTAPTPNCSLVFPSILFLNPCQYVCFEKLLLPSISVRKHNDGTLCTPAFGFLGIGTCHNGTCVQPQHSTRTTPRPLVHFDRGTFQPRELTTAESSQPSAAATKAVPSTATSGKPVETTEGLNAGLSGLSNFIGVRDNRDDSGQEYSGSGDQRRPISCLRDREELGAQRHYVQKGTACVCAARAENATETTTEETTEIKMKAECKGELHIPFMPCRRYCRVRWIAFFPKYVREDLPNGTKCKRVLVFKGICKNGKCVKRRRPKATKPPKVNFTDITRTAEPSTTTMPTLIND